MIRSNLYVTMVANQVSSKPNVGDKFIVTSTNDPLTNHITMELMPIEEVTGNNDHDPLPPSLGEVFILGFMADLENIVVDNPYVKEVAAAVAPLSNEQLARLINLLSK